MQKNGYFNTRYMYYDYILLAIMSTIASWNAPVLTITIYTCILLNNFGAVHLINACIISIDNRGLPSLCIEDIHVHWHII